MTDQVVRQERLASQTQQSQQEAQLRVVTLWSQLEPERQTQLAQRLAELIQRMRKDTCQEKNGHEWA